MSVSLQFAKDRSYSHAKKGFLAGTICFIIALVSVSLFYSFSADSDMEV